MTTSVQRTGRPKKPPGEALVAYGLHLSPDKIEKLRALKTAAGLSVRELLEGWIEAEFEAHLEARRRGRNRSR